MGKLSWGKRCYAVLVLCATTGIAAPTQTFTTLVNLDGTNGAQPVVPLVQATDGNFYGTTDEGGTYGYGTVFKIAPAGTLTTLHSFTSTENGADSEIALIQATDGNFYGTTFSGGDLSCNAPYGCGTVFKITPSGTLTTLHSFDGSDGVGPHGGLVQATGGDFYGTTSAGGDLSCNAPYGCGTVFKVTPAGTLTTLHSFDGTDGSSPQAGLVQATGGGNFYGTTSTGGDLSCNAPYGCGTVFKVTPAGTLTTLHSFDGTDGSSPQAGLVQATDGSFYGTAAEGGHADCFFGDTCGTVFKITAGGTLTTLHFFDYTDGYYPVARLVQATDGNFYGTTYNGGDPIACGPPCGNVFKMSPGGTLQTLHNFVFSDGAFPQGGLLQATNGTLYGTTPSGGANRDGTVFSLSVGLSPFVGTQPASGKVGAAVKVLGTNLTGATSVSFNGTTAPFKVVSRSEITTVVPFGATTGKVQVVMPWDTLSSNVNFQVEPPGFCPGRCFSPLSRSGDGRGN